MLFKLSSSDNKNSASKEQMNTIMCAENVCVCGGCGGTFGRQMNTLSEHYFPQGAITRTLFGHMKYVMYIEILCTGAILL